MNARVTSLGNEGFRVEAGGRCVYVDAFAADMPEMRVVPPPAPGGPRADLILVTHNHWDHFDSDTVALAAERTGATVVAPADAIRQLRRRMAADRLAAMEPPRARSGMAAWVDREWPAARVRAFRTFHGSSHNSYLVEVGGFRFFHDGDNEDTRRLDRAALGRVDALMVGPWQGAGYVEFIEALAPRRWFLMHLSFEELEEYARGTFLTETCGCDRVPPDGVALRPGETTEVDFA